VNGRLSALDDSFLAVESANAHMHVGWAARFSPPQQGPSPSFTELRDHIESRLCRAPRYRQRLAQVPLGMNAPVWVDDEDFDIDRHVVRSSAHRLADLADSCMSRQLPRDRPMWQICISDQLEGGGIGLIGKAHHCMVDGIAAVELASLLLDPSPVPPTEETGAWRAKRPPGPVHRLVEGVLDRVMEEASLARFPMRLVRAPWRVARVVAPIRRTGGALAQSARPSAPVEPFNQAISPARHLAWFERPLADLKRIGRAYGASVNDVLLAAAAGGMRNFLKGRDQEPAPLKTMVPVNVRGEGSAGELGNRISFLFIDLPCDEPDPVRRLQDVQLAMGKRKDAGDPEGAEVAMEAVKYLPRTVQHAVSKTIASPRTFNLTVSNIPGLRDPMYMLGCGLQAAYPVVPLAEQHALSVGMTTVRDNAFFGLYAARDQLPDADRLAEAVDSSIDELLERTAWAVPAELG